MNENAKKVVEALRSGDYQQTRDALHDDKGYCCLGVACDIYRQEVGGKWRSSHAYTAVRPAVHRDGP